MADKIQQIVESKKEAIYRGKNIDFLKTLDAREAVKFIKSRSRRYIMRNFVAIDSFVQKCEKRNAKRKKIRTHLRDMVILPKLVGMVIGVYNGKSFEDVHIVAEMIGHRLGEFSMTTGKVAHSAAGIGATKSSRAMKK